MALQQVTNQIWTSEYELPVGPGVSYPTRSLIYRDRNGKVLILSPGPMNDSEYDEIRKLGPVRGIVAPNLLHHHWIGEALEAFPESPFYRPHELLLKRPDLEGHGRATEDLSMAGFADLEFQTVRGTPRLQETVFYFPNDKLLYVTDLAHHITKKCNWPTRMLLKFFGTENRFAVSRMLKWMTRDPDLLRTDLKKILNWEIDKLVMAHGQPLMKDAKLRLAPLWACV